MLGINTSHLSAAELISIATGDYPPWTSRAESSGGVLHRIISAAFALEGIDVEYAYYPWARSYLNAKIGRYNAASYWACNVERQRDFICSDALFEEKTVFFHLKSTEIKSWNSLAELSRYRIGATQEYTYSEAFWDAARINKLHVFVVQKDEQNFHLLLNGRIELFPMGRLAGLALLHREFSSEQRVLFSHTAKPLIKQSMHLLFPRVNLANSQRYAMLFNRGLQKLKDDGRYASWLSDVEAEYSEAEATSKEAPAKSIP